MIRRTSHLMAGAAAGVLLLIVLLLAIQAGPVSGQPVTSATTADRPEAPNAPPTQPFEPYGYVTDGGASVSPGTVIEAYCVNTVDIPSTVVFAIGSETGYFVTVPGDDPDTPEKEGCFVSEEVLFEIDGQLAYQTATWTLGDNPQIDLTTGTPAPAIELVMLTNDQLTPAPPGVFVEPGQPVTWTYIVSSTGNVSLNNVSVVDDHGTPAEPGDDVTVCEIEHLTLGEPQVCTFSLTATLGSYANIATAAADFNGDPVDDTATGYYQAVVPGLALSLRVNGQDADVPPGPTILAGAAVNWSYHVTNTGGITLTQVTLWEEGGPMVCQITDLGLNQSDACGPPSGSALAGPQVTNGLAIGTPLDFMSTVTDTDVAHYFGAAPGLDLEKFTNDEDADTAPGPRIAQGDQVSWRYEVNNTGNVTLNNVVIRDDNGTPGNVNDDFDVCTVVELPVSGSQSCTNNGLAILGQYGNMGLATTLYASQVFSDTDYSHYLGVEQVDWLLFLPYTER